MRNAQTGWVSLALRPAVLALTFLIGSFQVVAAQPPECPTDEPPTIVSGSISGVASAPDITINLKSCQTLSVTVQTSDSHA